MPHKSAMTELDAGELPGTAVFDGRCSRRGYRLNKLAMSLTEPANRARFLGEPEAYMDAFGLGEAEKDAVRRRDWAALIAAGGNIYLLLKIAATVGQTLLQMGAQMRGESLDAFMATRPGRSAR